MRINPMQIYGKKCFVITGLLGCIASAMAQTYPNDVIYVAEEQKLRVSMVESNGVIDPFANGVGLIYGLASDQNGGLYAAGTGDNTIRKVGSDGVVTSFVSLDSPSCMTLDTDGFLYVANDAYGLIYQVSPSGQITTYASGFAWPEGLVFGTDGNLYAANLGNGFVDQVAPDGGVTGFASGFGCPWGLARDNEGNLYVAESCGNTIGKISPTGAVSTFATGLSYPTGVAVDSAGYVYVCNIDDGSLRKISPEGLMVTYATGLDYPTDMTIQRRNVAGSPPVAVPRVSNAFTFPVAIQSLIRSNYTGPVFILLDCHVGRDRKNQPGWITFGKSRPATAFLCVG